MGGEITVLVVDEDDDVLELTETFLRKESTAITALPEPSATAAVDRVRQEPIDCVVSDLRMPEMDGLDLFDALREFSDVPFFLLTAADGEETIQRAESAGVTGLVLTGAGTDHYTALARDIETATGA
jgi:CheY-like chemotaxis protein